MEPNTGSVSYPNLLEFGEYLPPFRILKCQKVNKIKFLPTQILERDKRCLNLDLTAHFEVMSKWKEMMRSRNKRTLIFFLVGIRLF